MCVKCLLVNVCTCACDVRASVIVHKDYEDCSNDDDGGVLTLLLMIMVVVVVVVVVMVVVVVRQK